MQVTAALSFCFLQATYVGVAQNASKCRHNDKHINDNNNNNNNTWPMQGQKTRKLCKHERNPSLIISHNNHFPPS
jgi:hypothetical protein